MIISLLIREEACESFNSSLENTKILDISISSRECYKLYHLENTLYAYLSIPVIELPSDWLKSSALIGIGFDFKTSYFKVFTTFPIIWISYAPLWYWRIYKKQDRENVERSFYVKIIHVKYDIFTNGL